MTSKRLKILFFTDFYLPHAVGGAELSLRDIILEAKKAYDCTIFVSDIDNKPQWRYDGLDVIPLFSNPPYSKGRVSRSRYIAEVSTFYLKNFLRTYRLIRAAKPDLIHLCPNNIFSLSCVSAMILLNTTIIIDVRNFSVISSRLTGYQLSSDSSLQRLKEKISSGYEEVCLFFIRNLLIWAARFRKNITFVPISEYMKSEMLGKGFSAENIEVIHNMLPEYKISPTKRREKSIVYAGRLEEEKGVLDLLHAFINVKSQIKLYIVGDGSLLPTIKKVIARKKIKNVVLLGKVSQDEVIKLYAKSRAVIAPSRWGEPFGRFILESFATETPLISTKVGGIPEAIHTNENGILVSVGSIKELSKAIDKIASDDIFFNKLITNIKKSKVLFSRKEILHQRMNLYKKNLVSVSQTSHSFK